jgi:FkbM family methyltransferase
MLLTNDLRYDGFGAQYQSLIWTILFTELKGDTFLYSDIREMHNPTNDMKQYIENAVKTMNLKHHYPDVTSVGKVPIYAPKWPYFYGEIEQDIEKFHTSDSFAKIKSFYYENKTNPFDTAYLNVAVHVRRPVSWDIGTLGNKTPDLYYISVMAAIQQMYAHNGKPIKFHIYSQGTPDMFDEYKLFPIQLHLDDDTFESFNGMVFADILVTSSSSMSYTAGLLSDGTVVYKPFWHPPRRHWLMVDEEGIQKAFHLTKSKKIDTTKSFQFLDICREASIPMENGKFAIPETIKRVKIDVGLSYGAPFSCKWLDKEEDLIVFGFEPHPHTYQFLRSQENPKYHPVYNHIYAPIPHIDKRLFIFPVALLDKSGEFLDFYEMNGDVGTSSLFKPKKEYFENKDPKFTVGNVTKVPVFTLKDFFDVFPFDKIPYIEYLKIDAQGSDLRIVKGAGKYIQERVVFVTLEADGHQYEEASDCNVENIDEYMKSIGFQAITHPNTTDPTFVNLNFLEQANSIWILQKF